MNPQAFPSSHQNAMNGYPSEEMRGMDLRDYFAAKALQGICSTNPTLDWTNDAIAKDAYRLADAMMKARND